MEWLMSVHPMTRISLLFFVVVTSLAVFALLLARQMRVQEARKKLWNDGRAARKGAMSSFMERCTNLLEGSGISMSAYELASIWVACCILPPLVAAVIDASFEIVIICALLGVFAPPLYLRVAKTRNQKRFEEMLGQTMPLIASNLKAGNSLNQAFRSVVTDMEQPISGEFRILCDDIDRGMPIGDALEKMADRNNSKDLKLFASAVRTQERTGGNLATIVNTVGETIRARVQIRQEINSKTSQGRATAIIMVLVPPLLTLSLFFSNEMYHDFYVSPMGLIVLAACALMELVGFFSARKICDIKTD